MSRRNASITKKQVDEVFEKAESQSDYTIGLYRLVFPKWEELAEVGGFPEAGKALSLYIWDKAIAFDKKHHTSMAGGMWLNNGFSTNANLGEWEVSTANCHPQYLGCA